MLGALVVLIIVLVLCTSKLALLLFATACPQPTCKDLYKFMIFGKSIYTLVFGKPTEFHLQQRKQWTYRKCAAAVISQLYSNKVLASIMSLHCFLSNLNLVIGFFSRGNVYSILLVEWPKQL